MEGWPLPAKAEYAHLRLKRRGHLIGTSFSPDGEKWTPLSGGGEGRFDLPAKIKIGLAAYSTSSKPSKVRFDEFKLIQRKKTASSGGPLPLGEDWDKPLDPDKNCKIIRDRDSLTIELPGKDHDYDIGRDRFNAPRMLREIEGDFVMRVRVRVDCNPKSESLVVGQATSTSAGFLIVLPGKGCVRMEYGVRPRSVDPKRYVALMEHLDPMVRSLQWNGRWDARWKHWPLATEAEYAYLRVQRRGEMFYPALSPDGEKWEPWVSNYSKNERDMPAKIKIGLAAYSTSSKPSKVRFDEFELTQGERDEP